MSIFNPTDHIPGDEKAQKAPDAESDQTAQDSVAPATTGQDDSEVNSPRQAISQQNDGDGETNRNAGTTRRRRGEEATPDRLRKLSAETLDKRVAEASQNLDKVLELVTTACARLKQEAGEVTSQDLPEAVTDGNFGKAAGRLIRAHTRLEDSVRLRRQFERDKVSRQSKSVLDYVIHSANLTTHQVEDAMKLVREGKDPATVMAALFNTTVKPGEA